jgi:hypothetical protein
MGSADLRVFFVKIGQMPKVEDAKRIEGCQLNSEIDLKETSMDWVKKGLDKAGLSGDLAKNLE